MSAPIHVRAVWLNVAGEIVRGCRAVLSPEEIARADRFALEHLTRRYEIAHGTLRFLLADYLKLRPEQVEFTYGSRGKPELRNNPGLRFNMTHSGDLALYAFAFDCEVGVDVEAVRDTTDLESVARRFFCPVEISELLSVEPAGARLEAFFRCWTRKEAYIKAIGEGLHLPLDRFQVTLRATDPARFVVPAGQWNLHHLDPAPGYVGALAYPGEERQVILHPPPP